MSKVRIYELAKESGLKSKELADKLIALGYPIKSHSSTVDDDMAEEIRRKFIGSTKIEVSDGKIDTKNRAVAKKKVSTVIRRRSRAEKEEIARKAEEAETAASEEQKEKDLIVEPKIAVEEEPIADVHELDQYVEETAPRTEISEVELKEAGEVEHESIAVEVPGEKVVEKEQKQKVAKPDKKKKEAKRRKGLAKVVGKVDIQVADEDKVIPARPSKEKKRPGSKVQTSLMEDVDIVEKESDKTGIKGKRKNKRVVAIDTDETNEKRKKQSKPERKGRRKIDFTRINDFEYMRPRKSKGKRSSLRKEMAAQAPVAETKAIKKRIKVFETISVGDLAKRMGIKASEVIAKLMGLGVLATLNQALDLDTATLVAGDFGYEVEQGMTEELGVLQLQESEAGGEEKPRPPVVTVMGHVDHGKTSILDAIRKTDVAAGEAGGITQHIGAYHVKAPSGDLVFVDTPGHAAFTEMRSRGAQVTDIVVLVVAADDGVMEQTKEAIAHAKAANVPIVVAVNKIDKDNADPDRVKRELSDFGLIPEDWGGDTIYCHTSAKFNKGIDELLENIQLQAEILELRADPSRKAKGTVIEAQLHKGRGAVATVLVQEGTIHTGDHFVAGLFSGKVRSLTNDRGESVEEAGPSMPVEVQGLSGVPNAGDEFIVVTDERMAKNVSTSRQLKAREYDLASASKVSLDNLFEKMAEQDIKELCVVLRADVQGTLEAFGQAAEKLSTNEIRVRVLHEGAGSITENDVNLAAASNAVVIGFNVRPTVKVKELAEREGVDIRSYDVIYHALEDIEKAMVGMLEPTYEERVIGTAEVRQIFHIPKIGTIAGCLVVDGKIERSARVRLLREGVVVYVGSINSLKRFKDDAKEVLSGYECGIGIENFNDIKVNDTLEAFLVDEVEAKL